ncbi:hypothetical protein PGTUg99_002899 [Puccinia graminis f. sp. tritici]|uniref:Uncharacterized protein n=2 Tax=Puccinia graminis f. sp. tritici TaxID=56615 RepID=A0A5B0SJZ4_PUCGR|nr:hypothetical protein PGTUg99_002899 [Puccinia graminis f. sp. tritici]
MGSDLNQIFSCHCGAPPITLPNGRMQNAQLHWESRTRKSTTASTSNTKPISTYFTVKRSLAVAPKDAPLIKKRMIACSGLNDKTWIRPHAQLTIQNCIEKSPSPYHGAPPRHEVSKELFGTTCESELDEAQLSVLIKTLESRSTWFIKQHDTSSGIFSTKCERNISAHPDQENLVCKPCLELKKNTTKEYLCFNKIDADVVIQVPLLGELRRPVVAVQDPKHARKTASNQLLSGARCLAFGRFHVNISHLAGLLDGPNLPLYTRDVLNCDKQDDGRAYRTLNADTFEAALRSPQHTGLAIYLFLFGELTDAWLSLSMTHLEQIRSAWTTIFFLRMWHNNLENSPSSLMGVDRNGVSRQSYGIFHILGKSLIGLIISHREYYDTVPFLPWKHGTEACEHIFGWMRVIMPNFTVLDARHMLPKVFAVVRQVMSGHIKLSQSYKYNFANEKMAESYVHLAKFPTNIQITRELSIAESRAHELAEFAGMTNRSVMEYRTGKPSRPVLDPEDSGDPDKGETDLGEVMQHAALSTAEQQETKAQFGHIDVEHEHEEISSETRISIANLLNPIVPATSTNPGTLLDVGLLVTNPDGDQILNNNLMLEMRQEHDSANIGSHSGNKKKKNHAPTLQSSTNSEPQALKP